MRASSSSFSSSRRTLNVFVTLSRSYETLSDPAKRKLYDQYVLPPLLTHSHVAALVHHAPKLLSNRTYAMSLSVACRYGTDNEQEVQRQRQQQQCAAPAPSLIHLRHVTNAAPGTTTRTIHGGSDSDTPFAAAPSRFQPSCWKTFCRAAAARGCCSS